MDYALIIDLKWFYTNDSLTDNLYHTFSIIDKNGFTVAKGIKEEDVAISIINNHNEGIN